MDNGGALGGVTSYQPAATAATGVVAPPASAGGLSNGGVQLSVEEHALYEELFAALDVGGDERIQGSQASVLLRATNLPTETLQLITELSGAKRVGHFGRSQFFRALKLIAGAQNGLKPSSEVLAAPLPLPKLNMATAQHTASTLLNNNNNNNNTASANNCYGAGPGAVADSRSPEQQRPQQQQQVGGSTASADAEKTWASFNCLATDEEWSSSKLLLQQLHTSSEEHRHLLGGTAGDEVDVETDSGRAGETEDGEDGEGIWTITREQRAYYVKQFAGMQSDLERGRIQGRQAKEFFEKSRLPVAELSRIWQLADIDRDGQLALDEFCTAMHLVVLRRNGIHLPAQLPPQLLPDIPPLIQTSPLPVQPQHSQPLATVVGSSGASAAGNAINQTQQQQLDSSTHHRCHQHQQQQQQQQQHISTKNSTTSDTTNSTAAMTTTSLVNRERGAGGQGVTSSPLTAPISLSKQWMKFSPSPTSGPLGVQQKQTQQSSQQSLPRTSPTAGEVGTGPVSFDFSTTLVNQDPRILHPVARRPPSSPEGQMGAGGGGAFSCDPTSIRPTGSIVVDAPSGGTGGYVIMNNSSENDHDALDALESGAPHLISTNSSFSAPSTADALLMSGIGSGSGGCTVLSGSGTGAVVVGNSLSNGGARTPLAAKKEPPPPPPPRPLPAQHRGHHARSSSLDLNPRATGGHPSSGTPLKGLFPPAVPPRSSPANGVGAIGGSGGVARSLSGDSSRGGISQISGSSSKPPKIGAAGGAFQVYSGKTRTTMRSEAAEPGAAHSRCASDSSCSSSSSSCNSSYEDLSLDPTTDDAAMLLVDDDHTECGYVDTAQQAGQGQPAGQGMHLHRPHHRKHELPDAMMAQFITDIPTDREQLIRDISAHRERNAMLREWNRELHDELQQLVQERLSLQSQKQPTSTI